jgi:hypothetical protein
MEYKEPSTCKLIFSYQTQSPRYLFSVVFNWAHSLAYMHYIWICSLPYLITQVLQLDTIGFWRWCITHRDIGFSDFVHRPDFSLLFRKIRTMDKVWKPNISVRYYNCLYFNLGCSCGIIIWCHTLVWVLTLSLIPIQSISQREMRFLQSWISRLLFSVTQCCFRANTLKMEVADSSETLVNIRKIQV